jgi:hypothetical protein
MIGLVAGLPFLLAGGLALANDREKIVASCLANLNLPTGGCDCIADKAVSDFNEREFAFFVAVISGTGNAQAMTQSAVSVQEATRVATRMTKMPTECAGG